MKSLHGHLLCRRSQTQGSPPLSASTVKFSVPIVKFYNLSASFPQVGFACVLQGLLVLERFVSFRSLDVQPSLYTQLPRL
jgi:hypothetical protein